MIKNTHLLNKIKSQNTLSLEQIKSSLDHTITIYIQTVLYQY